MWNSFSMREEKYLCYLQRLNKLDSGILLVKINNTYYTFNQKQLEFLKYLNNNASSKEEIYRRFSGYSTSTIDQIIDHFYKRGILFEKNSFENKGFKFLSLYRRFTRFYLPQALSNYIEKKREKFIHLFPNPVFITKLMMYCSPILTFFIYYAWQDIQLNIDQVPRNAITFLVGSVTAIIHELLLMMYHLKFGRKAGLIYIRIIYFVIISFGTEWGASYSEKKHFRVWMFLFSMLSIFYLSGVFFSLFYLLRYLNFELAAYYMSVYAVGTLIFAFINAYPFLLKTDGYMIYQETFGVYKLRSLFFKTLIYYFGMRKNLAFKEVVRRNSFKTYIWDVFFILSLIVVIYILSNNIRIII